MATPQQLLSQAKGRIKQAAVSPNAQGTRGTPSRGGQAARPRVPYGGGGAAIGGGAAPVGAGKSSLPGSAGTPQALQSGPGPTGPTKQQAAPSAGPPLPLSGGGEGKSAAPPGFKFRDDGPGVQASFSRPVVEQPGMQEKLAGLPPQLQQAIKDRGLETVMANRAGLAGRLGMPGAPAAPGPGGPDQAVSDAAALGVPAPTGPRPLPPSAEPGGAPGLQVQSFPGFKPRPGGMVGSAIGNAAGALTARPMPGAVPTDGPQPAAPGDGFSALGRVGAGLRRPMAY